MKRNFKKNSTEIGKKASKLLRNTDNLIHMFGEKVGKLIAKEWSPCCGVCRLHGYFVDNNNNPVQYTGDSVELGRFISEILGDDYIVYIQGPGNFTIIGTEKAREDNKCTPKFFQENYEGFIVSEQNVITINSSRLSSIIDELCKSCPNTQMYWERKYDETQIQPYGPKIFYGVWDFLDTPHANFDIKYEEDYYPSFLDANSLFTQLRNLNTTDQNERALAEAVLDTDCAPFWSGNSSDLIVDDLHPYWPQGGVLRNADNDGQHEFGPNALLKTWTNLPVGCCCERAAIYEEIIDPDEKLGLDVIWIDCVSTVSELPTEGDFCDGNWIYVADGSADENSAYWFAEASFPEVTGTVLQTTTSPAGAWYDSAGLIWRNIIELDSCQGTNRAARDQMLSAIQQLRINQQTFIKFSYHMTRFFINKWALND